MNKYMMATKAYHNLGGISSDISSDSPDLCFVSGEDESNYIGNWIEGWAANDTKTH